MMQNQRLLSVLSTLLFLVTFVSAISWPDLSQSNPNDVLVARQNNNGNGASSSASQSSQPQQTSSASASQGGSASASGSASGTITSGASRASGTASSTNTGSRSGNSTSTEVAVDPRDPPGGVSMMKPAQTDPMTFLKVGDKITFAWNYTSLLVTPSNVDVVATNNINHQAYTITANASFSENQTVVWDTGDASNTIPFVVASYTLLIYEAGTEPTDVPSPGHLGAAATCTFGIYTAQPYTGLGDFNCATCSGAMSLHEQQALKVILGSFVVTILSFAWFASGFGMF